jgi:CRP/FNR family transcriptional regulator, cyclic AMP receptor protein
MTVSQVKAKERCENCSHRFSVSLCALTGEAGAALDSAMIARTFPKGSRLFIEGQPAQGLFLLCSGRVKLYANSTDGKAIVFRLAEPGDVLGLTANLTGDVHEATAVAIDECRVNFVSNIDFSHLMKAHIEVALRVLDQLALENQKLYEHFRSLGFAASATDKLATLLLDWCGSDPLANGHATIHRTHTHEEIAEMIGTSRETVTRIFASLRDRGLIVNEGSTLFIPDRQKLENAIRGGRRTKALSGRNRT